MEQKEYLCDARVKLISKTHIKGSKCVGADERGARKEME